jgi:hypothetical protein
MVPGMYHCAFGPGPNAFGNRFSGQVYAAPPPVEDMTGRPIAATTAGGVAGRGSSGLL